MVNKSFIDWTAGWSQLKMVFVVNIPTLFLVWSLFSSEKLTDLPTVEHFYPCAHSSCLTSSSPICRSHTHTLSYFWYIITHYISRCLPLPLHIPLWTFACATSSSVWVVLSVVMVKVVGFCDALCVYRPEILDVRWSLWALRWCRNSGTLWKLMFDMKWWKMVVLCGSLLWNVWNVCRCVVMSKNDSMSNVVWLVCLLLCMPWRVWSWLVCFWWGGITFFVNASVPAVFEAW